MAEEKEGDRYVDFDDRLHSRGHHLGWRNGPFLIPGLIRAIHLTSLFAVLKLQAGGWAKKEGNR
jgi:hypothetical protein